MRFLHTHRTLIFGAMILCFFCACKREELMIPETNDPVFRAIGEFDGAPFELIAGDSNAYMHTMSTEENGIRVFSGRLDNGEFAIEIGIYDGNIDVPLTNMNEQIPSSLEFSKAISMPIATLSKTAFANSSMIDQIEWWVNGELEAINTLQILHPGRYDICANVRFVDGTSAELCSPLVFGFRRGADCSLKHFVGQNQLLNAWIQETTHPIESVKWFVDGQSAGESYNLLQPLENAGYLIESEILFQNGAMRSKRFIADGSANGKFIQDLEFLESSPSSLLNDFNVRINIMSDELIYRSDIANNLNSTFTISSIDEYGLNSEGKNVYKITGSVHAFVKHANDQNAKEISFATEFGVEIP